MTPQETRKYERSPAYLGGQIYFEHTPSTFECLVTNVSDNGAQLNVDAVWSIPDNFRLYIRKNDGRYVCETKWRTHNKLGVRFKKIAKKRAA